jgi:hypothetical protein
MIPALPGKHGSVEAGEAYRRDKYQKRIQSTVDVNLDEGTVFDQHTPVFPVAYKKPGDTRPSLPTVASKTQAIKSAHYIAKNTAHCYYNGNCVYKYNKIGDFYEVSEDTDDTIIVPNRKSKVSGSTVGAGRFSVGGRDVGISICYDQSLSVQDSNDVNVIEPLQKTAGAVDIHIILSAHIEPFAECANLKPGGLLLSCSSKSEHNKVLFYNGLKFSHADQADIKGIAKLDLYQLYS